MAAAGKPAPVVIRSGATWVIALLAALIFPWPRISEALIFERADIFAGQAWRLWTGHLVHYTGSHLFWDLLVFLAGGTWLELIAPRLTRWFYLLTPPAISAALLVWNPTLERYAGLSGLATGVIVLLALIQWRRDRGGPAWFWPSVLALVVVKTVIEMSTHAPLFAHFESGVRVVPLAHIGGMGCALVAYAVGGWKIQPPEAPVSSTP